MVGIRRSFSGCTVVNILFQFSILYTKPLPRISLLFTDPGSVVLLPYLCESVAIRSHVFRTGEWPWPAQWRVLFSVRPALPGARVHPRGPRLSLPAARPASRCLPGGQGRNRRYLFCVCADHCLPPRLPRGRHSDEFGGL